MQSMRRGAWVGLLAVTAVIAAGGGAAGAARVDPDDVVLVKFRPDVPAEARREVLAAAAATRLNRLETIDVDVVAAPAGADALIATLTGSSSVEYAGPNHRHRLFAPPVTSDPRLSEQWALHNGGLWDPLSADADVDAPEAWRLAFGRANGPIQFPDDLSAGPEIGIIDTGVDPVHPDIAPKVSACGQATDGTGDLRVADPGHPEFAARCHDPFHHGTHVAGIAAAVTDNRIGIAGVAPSARVASCRVFGPAGQTLAHSVVEDVARDADIAACIDWLATRRVVAFNMSFGRYGRPDPIMTQAVARAWDDGKGSLPVAASGNSGHSAMQIPAFPASLPDVVSVASTNSADCRSDFSSYNAFVDIAAPGTAILSTTPGGYDAFSGTSMAAPHVTGAAALLAARRPDLSARQLRDALLAAVDDVEAVGRDNETGAGRLNLHKLVAGAPVPAPAGTGTVEGDVPEGPHSVSIGPRFCAFATPLLGRRDYRFDGVPAGTYRLRLHPGRELSWCATVTITVVAGQTTRRDLACAA